MGFQTSQQHQSSESASQGRLGQYTILEKIAQGGMAQVFKAKTVDPTGIERLVVIKRILPHISSQPEYVEMLIDEAKIAVHFTHGNIAQVYDLGRVGEDYFIVMEYVDGRTLSQINRALKQRHQKIPLDILLYCFIELCRGLSYIHRKTGPTGKNLGVVHRDVSPQNIILSYAGNVKVIDFGVAKADFIENKTEHGVLKGKFAYMSPEQTRGEKIDHRSDIFSIGTLLWEMITGERLFKRASNQETIKAVQKAKFTNASDVRADVPKALDKIIKKALSRSPRSRYQDANDMAIELEKLLFSINPEFRPLAAAKFLYDLFGPESDESSLPPPFFVKSFSQKAEEDKSQQSQQSARELSDDDVPTVREEIIDEDLTPVVKLPRYKRFPVFNWVLSGVVILLFLLGSVYAYYIHLQNQKAYLSFQGVDDQMSLFVNGEEMTFPEDQLMVQSHTPYEIRITKKGYKDFIKQLQLDSQEQSFIAVQLEKAIPPFGDLSIKTTPEGATVWINGERMADKTPVTLLRLPRHKEYHIRLEKEGYQSVERKADVHGGKETTLNIPLEVNFARLSIHSTPEGAEVYWNETRLGTTPYIIEHVLPNQSHTLRLQHPDSQEKTMKIKLQPGEQKTVGVDLKRKTEQVAPLKN